jgi:hypothetical protein
MNMIKVAPKFDSPTQWMQLVVVSAILVPLIVGTENYNRYVISDGTAFILSLVTTNELISCLTGHSEMIILWASSFNQEWNQLYQNRQEKSKIWRWLSSGMLRHAVLEKLTDVSEVLTASIIRVPDDGGNNYLWNVCQFLRDYTAQHPGRRRWLSSGF